MSNPLTQPEIERALVNLPGWKAEGDALEKSFRFGTFREAMSFLLRCSYEAEELNHHPDWSNVYNQVSIRLQTHDAGGKVTARDIELARRIQKLSWVG